MNTTTDARYVEVTLPNGTVVTKKATRNYTHAIVTEDQVLSWHTCENTAHRAWYRESPRHDAGALHIERVTAA